MNNFIEIIKAHIGSGQLKQAIDQFNEMATQQSLPHQKEGLLLLSRYNTLEREKNRNVLRSEDYQRERNIIASTLLRLLEQLSNKSPNGLLQIALADAVQLIEILDKNFKEAGSIESISSRLREKNSLTTEMADLFIKVPDLRKHYFDTHSKGIMGGMSKSWEMVPELESLPVLESFAQKTKSNFVRGCVSNALAAFIYQGKQDREVSKTILLLLDQLEDEADVPLIRNIERVRAALIYQEDLSAVDPKLEDHLFDFLVSDYEIKVDYLKDHFNRLWTRFNFFLTVELALFGTLGYLLFESSAPQTHLAFFPIVLGLLLSLIWIGVGWQDRALVKIYSAAINDVALRLGGQKGMGWFVGRAAGSKGVFRKGSHYSNVFSITQLPKWLAILFVALWLICLLGWWFGWTPSN